MRHDNSTSNLHNHVKSCNALRPADQGTVTAFAQGSTYSKETLRVYVALWVATSYRPFAIVDDPYFKRIITMFNPTAQLPSDTTVSRDVKDFLKIGQENLKQYLRVRTTLPI